MLRPSPSHGTQRLHNDDPMEWNDFNEYCCQSKHKQMVLNVDIDNGALVIVVMSSSNKTMTIVMIVVIRSVTVTMKAD